MKNNHKKFILIVLAVVVTISALGFGGVYPVSKITDGAKNWISDAYWNSGLSSKPYGLYWAVISGRNINLVFDKNNTLYIYSNPGEETYKYEIEGNTIILIEKFTRETGTHSFQYLKGEKTVIFDDVRYVFVPEE